MPDIKNHFDILVIGGGVIGASIFHHLVKAGYQVALLEKGSLVSGCTALSGGIVRCFHLNSELSDKAVQGWHYYQNFEKNTGIHCEFKRTGFVYFPKAQDFDYAKKEVARLARSFPIEWLDAEKANAKFGDLLTGKVECAIYEPESGYMDAVKTSHAWFTSAKAAGGTIYENTIVTDLHIENKRFQYVKTTSGSIAAKKVVLALGPYTPQFLDRLGVKHDLYTQVIQVDIRQSDVFNEHQPAFIDDVFDLNGRPNHSERNNYIGHPTYLKIASPEQFANEDFEHSKKIHNQGSKLWNWVKQSQLIQNLRTPDCYLKDGLGFVKTIDDTNSIYVATGFSGGGYKVAPWIGSEIQRQVQSNF